MRLSFQDNNVHRLHHIISNVLGSIDSEPCQRSLHQRKKEEQIDPFLYLARVRPRMDNSLKGRATLHKELQTLQLIAQRINNCKALQTYKTKGKKKGRGGWVGICLLHSEYCRILSDSRLSWC